MLIAAAAKEDKRQKQEGSAAGVDDSADVFVDRGETQGMLSVKACPLPDKYASSCWGMPYDAVTFHGECVSDDGADSSAAPERMVSQKIKLIHTAMDDHSRKKVEETMGQTSFTCGEKA